MKRKYERFARSNSYTPGGGKSSVKEIGASLEKVPSGVGHIVWETCPPTFGTLVKGVCVPPVMHISACSFR